MKKMIELEGRWKSYKCRSFVFYIFILAFIVFVVFMGVFIKDQYNKRFKNTDNKQRVIAKNINQGRRSNSSITDNLLNNNLKDSYIDTSDISKTNMIKNSNDAFYSSRPSIGFICRRVTTNKLRVRQNSNFDSNVVGYYIKGGMFCVENLNINGYMQTNNGWVNIDDRYSEVVDTKNMFVDFGFYEYQDKTRFLAQSSVEEIKVLDNKEKQVSRQPQELSKPNISNPMVVTPAKTINNTQPVAVKSMINISSEKITKEKEIELKIIDFKNTNDYDTAIYIAGYYFNTKDYSNSIKWALNASKANSSGKTKSQSFIIYARSLYASGKKEQAIDVLNKYIAKTNSSDAIETLKNIRQGNI